MLLAQSFFLWSAHRREFTFERAPFRNTDAGVEGGGGGGGGGSGVGDDVLYKDDDVCCKAALLCNIGEIEREKERKREDNRLGSTPTPIPISPKITWAITKTKLLRQVLESDSVGASTLAPPHRKETYMTKETNGRFSFCPNSPGSVFCLDSGENPTEAAGGGSASCERERERERALFGIFHNGGSWCSAHVDHVHTSLTSLPSLPAANVHTGEKSLLEKRAAERERAAGGGGAERERGGGGRAEGERSGGGGAEREAVVSGDTVEVDTFSNVCVIVTSSVVQATDEFVGSGRNTAREGRKESGRARDGRGCRGREGGREGGGGGGEGGREEGREGGNGGRPDGGRERGRQAGRKAGREGGKKDGRDRGREERGAMSISYRPNLVFVASSRRSKPKQNLVEGLGTCQTWIRSCTQVWFS
jgi:hypothetical protein